LAEQGQSLPGDILSATQVTADKIVVEVSYPAAQVKMVWHKVFDRIQLIEIIPVPRPGEPPMQSQYANGQPWEKCVN